MPGARRSSGCVDGDIDCLPTTCQTDSRPTVHLDGGQPEPAARSSCEVNALGYWQRRRLPGRLGGGPAPIRALTRSAAVSTAGRRVSLEQCVPREPSAIRSIKACEYLSDCSPEHQARRQRELRVWRRGYNRAVPPADDLRAAAAAGKCVDLSLPGRHQLRELRSNACASGMCSPFGCVPVRSDLRLSS